VSSANHHQEERLRPYITDEAVEKRKGTLWYCRFSTPPLQQQSKEAGSSIVRGAGIPLLSPPFNTFDLKQSCPLRWQRSWVFNLPDLLNTQQLLQLPIMQVRMVYEVPLLMHPVGLLLRSLLDSALVGLLPHIQLA
jgi:hypothetical protein